MVYAWEFTEEGWKRQVEGMHREVALGPKSERSYDRKYYNTPWSKDD